MPLPASKALTKKQLSKAPVKAEMKAKAPVKAKMKAKSKEKGATPTEFLLLGGTKQTPKATKKFKNISASRTWEDWQGKPPTLSDLKERAPPSPPKKEEPKVLPPHHHVDAHVNFFHALERWYQAKKHGQEPRVADKKIVHGQPGGAMSATYWEKAEKEMKANNASKEAIQGLAAMRAKEDRMLKFLWPEDPEGPGTEPYYARLKAEDEARRRARNAAEEAEARRQGWRPKHER